MKEFRANFPAPPDPATTPATKQPVKQYFTASTADGDLLPETELELTETASPWVQGPEDAEVTVKLRYKDASDLFSEYKVQTFKLPSAPDTIPPDAPGDFGQIEIRDPATP